MSKLDPKVNLTRQLDDMLGRSTGVNWPGPQGGMGESHIPAMDLYETGDLVVIELEMPGLRPELIEVYVEGQRVTVSAMKSDPGPCGCSTGSKLNYSQVERKYGRFFREVSLPAPCNTRDSRVNYVNGILRLEFRKVTDRRGERRRLNVE